MGSAGREQVLRPAVMTLWCQRLPFRLEPGRARRTVGLTTGYHELAAVLARCRV